MASLAPPCSLQCSLLKVSRAVQYWVGEGAHRRHRRLGGRSSGSRGTPPPTARGRSEVTMPPPRIFFMERHHSNRTNEMHSVIS